MPIQPKFEGRIKTEIDIDKRTKEILLQYSKFTKYSEGEILDRMISEILKDDVSFVKWLKTRRYSKKIDGIIFAKSEGASPTYEKTNETGNF